MEKAIVGTGETCLYQGQEREGNKCESTRKFAYCSSAFKQNFTSKRNVEKVETKRLSVTENKYLWN
jgi:hypothetical protein